MASVVFIICVPYEEKTDYQNVKEVKSKDENEANIISGVTNEADHTADDVETLTGPLNLAEVLENELRSLKVRGFSRTVTRDKKSCQVIFLEKTVERVESILARLTMVGIGKRPKSSVSIIQTSVHIQPMENVSGNVTNENVSGNVTNENVSGNVTTSYSPSNALTSTNENQTLLKETEKKESTKDQFKKSIKSRLTVEQVVESIKLQTLLTFDFVMFTILASFIAAVGLVEDNAVVLVASMLVSPLMGPILGGTFGTVIKNRILRNTGLKTELCGLIIAVTVGFLFGFISGPFRVNSASWNSKKGIWPTQEMTSRGMTRSLWVGMLIALPSGAGVALSVLGGNAGSLVGVAISASLLPPAVNSGMLLAYSIISAIKPPQLQDNGELNNLTLNCPVFKDNSYVPTYSCDMAKEAAIMAVISLLLTIVNIICILITATIVLKIKEVAPKASSSNATLNFWTEDLKIAREAYETHKGNQAEKLLKEWKAFRDTESRDSFLEDEEFLNMVMQVEETEEFQKVVSQAPRGVQNLHKVSRDIKRFLSKDDNHENIADQLRNLQTYYTQQSMKKTKQPHISTIFSQPEPEIKPKKTVREFHVVETEKPHHTSVVRVHAPTDDSNRMSVTTESGV